MFVKLIADDSVSSAPSGFKAAVQAAAAVFDKAIPGTYTVNITYGWGTYDNKANSGLQGGSNELSIGGVDAEYAASYSQLKSWLTSSAMTPYQVVGVNALPATSPYSGSFGLSSAEEKALGVFSGNTASVDGSIGFNTGDYANGVLSPYIEEGALAEIAHALGLYSGLEKTYGAYALDLFRYSSAGKHYDGAGGSSYFSVDGGHTNLANYSTSSYSGVSDPTLFTGLAGDPFSIPASGTPTNSLTALDLEELNAMGFAGNSNLFGTFTHDATSPTGEVYSLYQAVLGRAADSGGLLGYATQVENGTPITTIAQDLLTSGEYVALYGASPSDSSFVTHLYVDGLHRQPDAGGLRTYDNLLASGVSRAQVAVDIATSDESRADTAAAFQAGIFTSSTTDTSIAQLYYGLLDRDPDAGGLASHEVAAAQGSSLSAIASSFIGSVEYANLHGNQSDSQFVAALYQGALGRQADAGGEAHYVNALKGAETRAQVAVDISTSSEATNHLAPFIRNDMSTFA